MADYIPDIKTLIPHGPPMVLVDRLLGFPGSPDSPGSPGSPDSPGSTTRTTFLITADNPLTMDGKISIAGLIENMAQTAAAGAGFAAFAAGGAVSSGAIIAINNLGISRLPELGEELITVVTVTARVADIVVISGRITCGQSVVATGEMKILTGI
jgi:predicted hotdog family 3-hydroxylacyl-ACP dehydratase